MAISDDYMPAQKVLHWLVAALVAVQAGLGLWVAFAAPADEALAGRLYNAHDGTGAVILVLMLLRLAVRQLSYVPRPPRGTPRWAVTAAWANHRAFYLVLIVQPLLGWLNNGANGYPWSFYGFFDIPSPIGQNETAAALLSRLHLWGAVLLALLVVLHLGGVAFHTLVRRDRLLRRML
jgi:cytochrome b561